jgi:AraC-like DNA-binding protein
MHGIWFTDETRAATERPSPFSEGAAESRISVQGVEILDAVHAELERGALASALRLLMLVAPHADAPGARGGLAPWQKRKVDRYMREHLEQPLQVKRLAGQVSLSVSHFCRAFKESFGTTPHSYVIRLRLELAQRLMLTTRDPLSRIALACGLADQAHLSKLFRRWVGETPNAWRRRNFTGDQIEQGDRGAAENHHVPRLAA